MIRDGKTMLLDPDPLLGCNAKCSSLQSHQQEGLSQPLSCGHLCTQPCGKCCELTLLSAELPHVGIFVYYSFAIMWPLSHLDKIKQKNFYFIRYLTTNSKDTPRWSVHVALQPSISVRAPVRSYSVSRLQRMPSLYQAMPYKMPSYKVWRGLYSLLVNFLFFFFILFQIICLLSKGAEGRAWNRVLPAQSHAFGIVHIEERALYRAVALAFAFLVTWGLWLCFNT